MRNGECGGKGGGLRRRAEATLKERRRETGLSYTEVDTKRLLHELQVHQVELEMQNAELNRARAEAEANAEKFSDLYDFAPVGYVTLNDRGVIQELNLTAAHLLGRDRRKLAGQPFVKWVAPGDRECFREHLRAVTAMEGELRGEVEISVGDDGVVPVQLCTVYRRQGPCGGAHYRTALTDITELKQAEERVRVLNADLEARVAARTAEIAALLERSGHMQAQLRHLSHRVLEAQEEERKRISRELHDQIAQVLISIDLDLVALAREAASTPPVLKKRIERTQRLVEDSVNSLHRFTRELRPRILDDLGLIPALHAYMEDYQKRTGIRVRFTAFAGVEQLSSASRMALYRVVQAGLSNVAQHAKASRVAVRIQQCPRAVRLEIKDDGIGFVLGAGSPAKHGQRLGLLGMKERVEMVGGTFTIESAPGHGTTVRAEIPIRNGKRLAQVVGTR
jgi:PAS domain S-box-containing protein